MSVPARRTKIVATLGPSTADAASIGAVLDAGTDVVRLNGAHGSPATHARATELARSAAAARDRHVGVLIDLPGPKLRIGSVPGDEIELVTGAIFTLASSGTSLSDPGVTTNVVEIGRLVGAGDSVLLADGEIVLEVREVARDRVVTAVVRGGTLRSGKGLTVPGGDAVLDPFTPSDEEILELAVRLGAELVGVSFVRSATDIERVRDALDRRGATPQVIAKVETARAVEHIEEIARAADGVMVARGDLGAQIGVTRTPLVQKEIIDLCNRVGRPVITATQMLVSMTRAPLPTRAEATDVVNAVLDGTDALMLSEETGVGEHPRDAVVTMARLAEAAESWRPSTSTPTRDLVDDEPVATALAHAAVQAATESRSAAIICRTSSGTTARRIASLRPGVPIVAVTEADAVAAALTLVWGVTSVVISTPDDDSGATRAAARMAGAVEAGARVTVVASPRPGAPDPSGSVHVLPV